MRELQHAASSRMTAMWQHCRIAPEGTHHLDPDGRPCYVPRFDEVLKFHAPGLAPVRLAGQAWHVDPVGRPAYTARFQRTFGFYEGLAAVFDGERWHHVDPEGRPAYAARFAWCGNFQEGRTPACLPDGRYAHIDRCGSPVGGATWRYVGDYKDGRAVVQDDEGWHTHVDLEGRRVHDRQFLDLDVFHKGYARARDPGGWTHVDATGTPCYAERFLMVEPFYNGFARVERRDGSLVIIDERGREVRRLREPRRTHFEELSADLVGFWRTQALAAAVSTGVADALPGTAEELARRCGLNPSRTGRLLRALAQMDVAVECGAIWDLSAKGAYLRRAHPLTLADAALEYAGPMTAAWARLSRHLASDAPQGREGIFTEVAASPHRLDSHHRMLASYALHDYPTVCAALDLHGVRTLIDAGGGTGTFARLVRARHPEVSVTVLDLPPVVGQEQEQDGVTFLAQDLFEPWAYRADAVLFARVLHDWDDDRAVELLRRARASLRPGGRLFIVELLLPDTGSDGALCDLHLLAVTGGRDRSAGHYARLAQAAGFGASRRVDLSGGPSILCAEAL